ncbi:recombinase family protein [Tessaracoccus palaemonis]|uniref:Recombinase family protein n=1 Tax=Tessaracoccus palaemonis TaxID=2829499 RepID=A0ABX8SJV6_9ACTN|nr:recombinase family protein [Tessaracoccus palaemonis]QXT62715.1 recombinase family protein [Tessaracoccus palaemonis]
MDVLVYTRISRDTTGMAAGVQRQEADCRALAASHGWTITSVHTDNDTSAYSGTPRPGYQAVLDELRQGSVGAVVVWHVDRLYRRVTDLEEYIAACQVHGVPTYSVQAGPLDLTTPSGRMIARQLGAVAQYESEQKGERQRRANQQRAQQGRNPTTRRCFGYEPDGLTLRPAEADAIRDAYQALLAGASLGEIARMWNAAGLHGPQGAIRLPADVKAEWETAKAAARAAGEPMPPRPFVPCDWTGSVVSRTLRLPRLAGLRRYRGELVRDPATGELVRGVWSAIVDLETWRAAQDVLNAPDRQQFPSAERQLLSGLALCGECGATMQSGGTRGGRRRIRCSSKSSHAYRESEPIDTYVEAVIIERLSRPDARELLSPPTPEVDVDGIRAELRALAVRQEELAEGFADGAVTLAQLRTANERIDETRAQLEGSLPSPENAVLRRLVDADDVPQAWANLRQEDKRSAIGALAVVEILAPGTKEKAYLDWRARVLNPESLRITWRQGR